ncbi:hypothetical protein [Actinoallomurus soli]|uniref:hypothetical protein n=1 Tax=Actinoallomurus soli TaxID=2952535 RepID=UPI003873B07D
MRGAVLRGAVLRGAVLRGAVPARDPALARRVLWFRSAVRTRNASGEHPGHRAVDDRLGHLVASVELLVRDLVPQGPQAADQPAAAGVDPQDPVARPVRDEHARRPVRDQRGREPGGEGDHGVEQVAVGQSDRQGVRGAVGEPADDHAFDRVGVEDLLQHPVQPQHVGPESVDDQVPGVRGGLGRHEQEPVLVRGGQQQVQALARRPSGAVQEHHEPVRATVHGRRNVRHGQQFGRRTVEPQQTRAVGLHHRIAEADRQAAVVEALLRLLMGLGGLGGEGHLDHLRSMSVTRGDGPGILRVTLDVVNVISG